MSAWLALAAPPPAHQLNGQENISNASRDYQSLLLRLDHAHRSQPWKIMSIARAAMDNREAVAPRTLERGRGAVEKM
jgi:hypothetical protein